jgi:HEAT repeat protein
MRNWFEQLVIENWSKAVFEATARFSEVRSDILEALKSSNSEVRSAAVATLNEADDSTAHDLVLTLINDKDSVVRDEVFEYIEAFPTVADVPFLIQALKDRENLLSVSIALQKLLKQDGPTIDSDDPPDVVSKDVAKWEVLLRRAGYNA